ncbi:MAG: hypothetical protein JO182_09420, partial [Acidobacteriaceae bacterium]|nr:hypothetical protein [Acidobacteriaceae bacterium]
MLKTTKSILFLGAVLSLAPLALANTPDQSNSLQTFDSSFAAPTNQQQQEVSQLLKDISAAAFKTSVHAGRLESFVRHSNQYSWQTHAWELTQAKDLINSKGKALERLKELQLFQAPGGGILPPLAWCYLDVNSFLFVAAQVPTGRKARMRKQGMNAGLLLGIIKHKLGPSILARNREIWLYQHRACRIMLT